MSPTNKAAFYCGTSNVELPVPNKSHFPEAFREKSRLNYYASLFNTVEINSSFYKIPMRRTVERWAADVPPGFRFSFKLWKGITHASDLVYDIGDIHRFMTSVNAAGDKRGCVLIQFPASIRIACFQKLKRLLNDLSSAEESGQWHLAVEFRDRSWYNDKVYQLLELHGAAVVIQDIPKSATPQIDMETDFLYLRFHGERGDYRGSYDENFLTEQAENTDHWVRSGKSVFAYFNNTIGAAVENSLFLKQQALEPIR